MGDWDELSAIFIDLVRFLTFLPFAFLFSVYLVAGSVLCAPEWRKAAELLHRFVICRRAKSYHLSQFSPVDTGKPDEEVGNV